MNVTPDLDARFRALALAEGIVDVRYDVVSSPVGELHVASTERGLCRISYWGEAWEDELARQFGVRVLRSPLDDVRRELDEYFEGKRTAFDLPIDLRVAPTLVDRQIFFLFQPLAYQVATGSLSSVEVAVPLRQALRRQRNTRVVLGEVTGVDLSARTVTVSGLPNGTTAEIPYDVLAVA